MCQICFIPGHGAVKCRNRFNPAFVPQRNFGIGNFRPGFGNYGKGFIPNNFASRPFNGFGRNNNGQYVGSPRGYGFQSGFQGHVTYQNSDVAGANSQSSFYNSHNSGSDHPAAFNCFNGTTNASQFQSSTNFHTAPSPETVEDPSWYIDSGASTHITVDSGKLFNMQPYYGTESLLVGNGNALEIKHIGSTVFDTLTTEPLLLNNILHVPNITKNLLSVSQLLADNNVIVEFVGTFCFIKARKTETLLLKGVATGG